MSSTCEEIQLIKLIGQDILQMGFRTSDKRRDRERDREKDKDKSRENDRHGVNDKNLRFELDNELVGENDSFDSYGKNYIFDEYVK